MSFLKSRVNRLEEKQAVPDGTCPECGFRPDDVRVITFGGHDEPLPEWPPEDYCKTCGKLLPPVRLVDLRPQTEGATA